MVSKFDSDEPSVKPRSISLTQFQTDVVLELCANKRYPSFSECVRHYITLGIEKDLWISSQLKKTAVQLCAWCQSPLKEGPLESSMIGNQQRYFCSADHHAKYMARLVHETQANEANA